MPKTAEKDLRFNSSTKERVRSEAHNMCETCGKRLKKPQVHHRLPKAIARDKYHDIPASIITSRENAKALCETCHIREDRISQTYHQEFAEELRKKITR